MITKKVQIGDKTETFMASAATPLYYRRDFGEDFVVATQSLNTEAPDIVVVQQMAYSMSASRKRGVPFEEWLESFLLMDMTEALSDIIELIAANHKQQTPPTKKAKATDK